MKILVICYSYAPNIDPRALRWTALCEEWAKLGYEVHVVTGYQSDRQREETRNGVHLHRVGGGWLTGLRQWAGKQHMVMTTVDAVVETKLEGESRRSSSLLNGLRTSLKLIHDLTWKRLYWPDAICLWIESAFRYSRSLVRQKQFDALVSVSHPFSGHVVGLLVKRTVPELLWVADSGDPFAFSKESAPNNFFLYSMLNHWIEGKVLSGVSHFSVTTAATSDIYQKLFPADAQKVTVIPPLLQDVFYEGHERAVNLFDSDAIVLLFVGTFYRDIRSPVPLLNLLLQIIDMSQTLKQKLQLHVIGQGEVIVDVIHQYPQLVNRIILQGKLPNVVAASAMREASCLVNIGNATQYQLPSKVIEYMATGKPILNLCSIENDSSFSVLRDYPNHFDWLVNKSNDFKALCQFLEECPLHVLSDREARLHVQRFSKRAVSDAYLSLLRSPINR